MMRRFILFTFFLLSVSCLSAQTEVNNTAFKAGEQLSYNLYFNWKFVWYKVGSASLSTVNSKYDGTDALRCSINMKSNGKLDKFFFMRDTLISIVKKNLSPLYYRKGAHEGKRYTVDEVKYSYNSSECTINCKRINNDKSITRHKETTSAAVYDMLSLFLRARSYNFGQWKKNQTMNVSMVSGKGREKGKIIYKGKETVKADNGKKYNCLKLEFHQFNKSKNKFVRLATFFITDDARHIPIRLDFNLRFGEAKAYMTSMKGTL